MTSSLLILDTEAIYGYVSGTPQEGAREERDAESKRQRAGRESRKQAQGRKCGREEKGREETEKRESGKKG